MKIGWDGKNILFSNMSMLTLGAKFPAPKLWTKPMLKKKREGTKKSVRDEKSGGQSGQV